MRSLALAILLTGLAAAAVQAAPPTPAPVPVPVPPPAAVPAPTPDFPRPFVAPNVEFVRVGRVERGRWQYVNTPLARSGDLTEVWRIDVFDAGYQTGRGKGAFSVSLYSYDCRARALRLVHAELFDAQRKSLEAYDGTATWSRVRLNGDEDLRQACGEITYEGQLLRGLTAVLADAKAASGG